MATNRITVKRDGDKIVITSNDSNIKQVFFEWGSWGTGSGNREYPEFYGHSIEVGHHIHPDREMWQWDLTEELVRHLHQSILDNVKHEDLEYDLLVKEGVEERDPLHFKARNDVLKTLGDILYLHETQPEELDEFTKAYITAALWSTNDESDPETGGNPLDDNYGITDISPDAMKKIKADCQQFQEENADLLQEAYEIYTPRDGYSGPSLAGHDFWLTRCGHGVGFWDRGLGDVGEKLSEACRKFRECWIEVGDDGQLHGF